MIKTSVPVVVASQTKESIAHSARLAVVAYGDGDISIQRKQGRRAEVITHHFGGAVAESHVSIENGRLNLIAKQRGANGDLIEWMEIHIGS